MTGMQFFKTKIIIDAIDSIIKEYINEDNITIIPRPNKIIYNGFLCGFEIFLPKNDKNPKYYNIKGSNYNTLSILAEKLLNDFSSFIKEVDLERIGPLLTVEFKDE